MKFKWLQRSRFWAMALLFVAGTFPALVLLNGCSKRPEPTPEVPRSALTLREGRLYRTGETNTFLGYMVEFYKTNSMQSRSMVSNGLLNGLSEGWHTNGQLEIREFFKDGVSDGVRIKWHPNGAKLSEGNIVKGKHHGTFRRWYDNGALAEEIEMRNGNPEGPAKSFYPSGFLKSQAFMTNGIPTEQKTWNDGEKK